MVRPMDTSRQGTDPDHPGAPPARRRPGQLDGAEASPVRYPAAADAVSALQQADIRDAVEALERKETKITLLSLLALACMSWILMEAPPHLAFPWTVATLLGLKAAVREYLSLAARKTQILRDAESRPSRAPQESVVQAPELRPLPQSLEVPARVEHPPEP